MLAKKLVVEYKKKDKKKEFNGIDLLTTKKLRSRLKKLQLSTKGVKTELIERLKNALEKESEVVQEVKKKKVEKPLILDPQLTMIIREQLEEQGEISSNDLLDIICLDCFQQKIKDLTGIEYCKNLKRLIISNNYITDLSPLTLLKNLEELWINGNNIKNLDALKGIKLKALSISSNICDITSLKHLSSLKYLNLSHCKLSDISPLKDLINLEELNLNNNQITDISPLKNHINLKSLSLMNNHVQNIEQIKDLNIRELYLKGNNLKDLDVLSNMVHFKNFLLK